MTVSHEKEKNSLISRRKVLTSLGMVGMAIAMGDLIPSVAAIEKPGDSVSTEFEQRGVNVKWYGAKGDGTTDDSTAIAAARDSLTNGGILYFPPCTSSYRITTNLTFSSGITMYFSNGAKLSVDSGNTVTINGPTNQEATHRFSGSGLIAGDIKNNNLQLEWWGAIGDGVTVNTTTMQAAVNYAVSRGKTEIYVSPGTYLYGVLTSTSGITFIGSDVTFTGTTALKLTSLATLSADVVQRAFNVKSAPYNAVGDGVANDAAAIQAAIDACAAAGGGIVYFPTPSLDYFTGTTTIKYKAGVSLQGSGITACDIRYTGTSFALESATKTTALVSGIFIRDIQIVCSTAGARGLDITRVSYSSFYDMSFTMSGLTDTIGIFGTAAAGDGPYYNLFANIHIGGASSAVASGVYGYKWVSDTTQAEASAKRRSPNGNTIIGGRISSCEYGVVDHGIGNSWIGVKIESTRNHFVLGSADNVVFNPGTTGQTIVLGCYHEGITASVVYRTEQSAAGVKFTPAFITDYTIKFSNGGDASNYFFDPTETTENSNQIPGGNTYSGISRFTKEIKSLVALTGTLVRQINITGEAQARFKQSGDGKMEWGGGTNSTLDVNLYRSEANVLRTNDAFWADGGYYHGTSTSPPITKSGMGSPEGVLTANQGSIFMRTDGGAGTTFYVKETGSGNTGWVGK